MSKKREGGNPTNYYAKKENFGKGGFGQVGPWKSGRASRGLERLARRVLGSPTAEDHHDQKETSRKGKVHKDTYEKFVEIRGDNFQKGGPLGGQKKNRLSSKERWTSFCVQLENSSKR